MVDAEAKDEDGYERDLRRWKGERYQRVDRGDIPLGWVPLTRTRPVPASFRVQKSWRE